MFSYNKIMSELLILRILCFILIHTILQILGRDCYHVNLLLSCKYKTCGRDHDLDDHEQIHVTCSGTYDLKSLGVHCMIIRCARGIYRCRKHPQGKASSTLMSLEIRN